MKKLKSLEGDFGDARKKAEEFGATVSGIGTEAEKAGKGAEKGSKGLGQFASSLVRIAKYRLIRTALKELVSSFREGLANAYQFSKGVGGELAAALDTMAVKSQTMRNQLGAAFGELLINVMPIILRLIEVVRTAANAIAQLFAALGGRGTYLKAVDASKEWAKSTAGGAKAAKEWRNQLMGFDEINRLDAPSEPSGGGGGGDATNFGNMFQESPVPEWLQNLGERLQKLTPVLLTIAGIIAGISLLRHIGEVLGWGEAFQGVMTKITGIAIAIAGLILLVDGVADALKNGLDWGNLIEIIGGATLVVIGLATAFGTVGAAIGLLIGGLALLVVGVVDWIRTGQASVPVLTAISVGLLAVGGAIALLTGSWIPLVVAAIGAAVVWIVGKWDDIKARWGNLWSSIVGTLAGWVNAALDWIRPLLEAIDRVVGFFGGHSNLGGAHINVPAPAAYATGGFPEDGLFFANHSELVGQFANGQTAVANNEQIIAGIREGVYEAMMSANSGRSNEVKVYLDGKQISNAVSRNQRNTERATGVQYA